MIYPKDEMIERLLSSAVDEESGEILMTEEELAEKIAAFLARKYRYAVSGDEQFYLMIHIAKIIRKSQE